MGGMIAVAVRFRDGSVVSHRRTTGPVSWWLRDIRVARGDEGYLREYLANPVDWDPAIEFGPVGYGMVVVDLVENRIHEMHDYSSIVSSPSILHSLAGIPPDQAAKWKAFADERRIRIREVRIDLEANDSGYTVPATPMPEEGSTPTWEEILPLVSRRKDGLARQMVFEFDLSPLRYTEIYPDLAGTRALRASLAADGFDVSSRLWDDRIRNEEEAERLRAG